MLRGMILAFFCVITVCLLAIMNVGLSGCKGTEENKIDPTKTVACTSAPASFTTTVNLQDLNSEAPDALADFPVCLSVLGGEGGNFNLGLSLKISSTMDFGELSLLSLITLPVLEEYPDGATPEYNATLDFSENMISDTFTIIANIVDDEDVFGLLDWQENHIALITDKADELQELVQSIFTKLNDAIICTANEEFECADLSNDEHEMVYTCVYGPIKLSDFKDDILGIVTLADGEDLEENLEEFESHFSSTRELSGEFEIEISPSSEDCRLNDYIEIIGEIVEDEEDDDGGSGDSFSNYFNQEWVPRSDSLNHYVGGCFDVFDAPIDFPAMLMNTNIKLTSGTESGRMNVVAVNSNSNIFGDISYDDLDSVPKAYVDGVFNPEAYAHSMIGFVDVFEGCFVRSYMRSNTDQFVADMADNIHELVISCHPAGVLEYEDDRCTLIYDLAADLYP